MKEFQVDGYFETVGRQVEKLVSPRQYYLHNRVGGQGWSVQGTDWAHCIVQVDDPRMATWIGLQLERR